MRNLFGLRPGLMGLGLAVALLCNGTLARVRADSLVWNKQEKKVDAQIETWDLATVLRNIAGATGWQVYLEPNSDQAI